MPGSISFRYWRIWLTAGSVGNSGYNALAEINFKDGSGSTISRSGGTASASAFLNSSWVPANAFDGDASTAWLFQTPTTPQWVQYDFGAAVPVYTLDLTVRNNDGSTTPSAFYVQGSSDGVRWTTLNSYSGLTWSSLGQTQSFNLVPVVLSVSPQQIAPGQTESVTIVGGLTNFSSGSSTVSFSGSGLTVNSVTVQSTTQLTASVTADGGAATGLRDVTVTTGAESATQVGALNVGVGYQYWRLYVVRGASGVISLSELKLYDSVGTQIATTGGTASASSFFGGGFEASKAFDGDTSSAWNTQSGVGPPGWVQYQFSSAVDVHSFSITDRTGNSDQCAVDFSLQYSFDGFAFTDLYSYKGVAWPGDATKTFDSTNQANSYGYGVRLMVQSTQGGGDLSISELKFYDASDNPISTPTYGYICSNFLSPQFAASLAFDGSTSTFWDCGTTPSSGSPQWVGYIFPSDPNVKYARISPRAALFGQGPSSVKLQHSSDGVVWVDYSDYSTLATWTSNSQTQDVGGGAISQPIIFVAT